MTTPLEECLPTAGECIIKAAIASSGGKLDPRCSFIAVRRVDGQQDQFDVSVRVDMAKKPERDQ